MNNELIALRNMQKFLNEAADELRFMETSEAYTKKRIEHKISLCLTAIETLVINLAKGKS